MVFILNAFTYWLVFILLHTLYSVSFAFIWYSLMGKFIQHDVQQLFSYQQFFCFVNVFYSPYFNNDEQVDLNLCGQWGFVSGGLQECLHETCKLRCQMEKINIIVLLKECFCKTTKSWSEWHIGRRSTKCNVIQKQDNQLKIYDADLLDLKAASSSTFENENMNRQMEKLMNKDHGT